MTVTTSWDLFEDLVAAQDEVMWTGLGRARRHGHQYDTDAGAVAWAPAMEISERKDAYMVSAELPRSERYYGAFRRSITLPGHVQAGKIEATARDGVLRVLVPKAPDVQARRIPVRVGQSGAAVTQGGKADGS